MATQHVLPGPELELERQSVSPVSKLRIDRASYRPMPVQVSTPTSSRSPASTPFLPLIPDQSQDPILSLTPESLITDESTAKRATQTAELANDTNELNCRLQQGPKSNSSEAKIEFGLFGKDDIAPSDKTVAAALPAFTFSPTAVSAKVTSAGNLHSAGHRNFQASIMPEQAPRDAVTSTPQLSAPLITDAARTQQSRQRNETAFFIADASTLQSPKVACRPDVAGAGGASAQVLISDAMPEQTRGWQHEPGDSNPQSADSQGPSGAPISIASFAAPDQTMISDLPPNPPPTSSLPSFLPEPPLRTASVRASTKLAHPKPIALPSAGNPLAHPTPDLNYRAGAFVGNVVQLEATAERLSTGASSMAEAIRDLHGELKRSDSRRSSLLVRASAADDSYSTAHGATGPLQRRLSNSSSIASSNFAARHRGYSPGGFVMSPTEPITGSRLRSASKHSTGDSDPDVEVAFPRHGPGRASIRSIRSTKLSLAEISESEPISLTEALDEADEAPPIYSYNENDDILLRPGEAIAEEEEEEEGENVDDTSAYGNSTEPGLKVHNVRQEQERRPSSAQSGNTFQQAQNAFFDFDGVHCEEADNEDLSPTSHAPQHRRESSYNNLSYASADAMPWPQPFMDPSTGQHMLYYPAQVPAMLSLPPKLANKRMSAPAARGQRRSQILNAMTDAHHRAEPSIPNQGEEQSGFKLPDPTAGQRNSFAALSLHQELGFLDEDQPVAAASEADAGCRADDPHPPEIVSQPEPHNKRKSRLSKLPPQLRASAFFDLPSQKPEVEVKENSAMATLESMLDASMSAPVSAFTDNAMSGTLRPEAHGKGNKHAKKLSSSSAAPSLQKEAKKKSSLLWFKRSSSYGSEKKGAPARSDKPAEEDSLAPEHQPPGMDGGSDVSGLPNGQDEDGDEQSGDESEYHGQPTTLLAELQLRKQQQAQRTQPLTKAFPNGIHATLLEMDAVAETQRKTRNAKRVNLAWEEPDAHADQSGSDDEDVPLAIIAAKASGARNMADLERPLGLMERRQMEDNEPLSQRRARLQGLDAQINLPKRQAMASLSTHLTGHARTPSAQIVITPDPEEDEDDEVEGETLGDRKRRLAAKELPKARPVSSSFSAELLSQFGDFEDLKGKSKASDNNENLTTTPDGEGETLGQRRRRLQAEREAREREMNFSNLIGDRPRIMLTNRRSTSSMADILAANPIKENPKSQEERQRMEQERYAAQQRDAKLAAMRGQMPAALKISNTNRSGGFRSGIYNDGGGGTGAQSSLAVHQQNYNPMSRHSRSTTALTGMSTFGQQQQQQQHTMYAGSNYGGMAGAGGYAHMSRSDRANTAGMYGRGIQMPMQMPAQMSTGSIDRVEQWRHGVMP